MKQLIQRYMKRYSSSYINNNGDINIPAQSISLASLPIPVTVSGEGLIESQDSGNLKLKYSVLTFDFSCDADLSREKEVGSGE